MPWAEKRTEQENVCLRCILRNVYMYLRYRFSNVTPLIVTAVVNNFVCIAIFESG